MLDNHTSTLRNVSVNQTVITRAPALLHKLKLEPKPCPPPLVPTATLNQRLSTALVRKRVRVLSYVWSKNFHSLPSELKIAPERSSSSAKSRLAPPMRQQPAWQQMRCS